WKNTSGDPPRMGPAAGILEPSLRPPRSRRAGFSLVELVAVIVIVAVLAGAAAPALLSIGSTRAVSAARHLLADLTHARQSAMATGVTCWIVFEGDAWTLLQEAPDAPGF